jgi:transposase-like protein
MLSEKLHDHLGYGKYETEHKNTDNSRNGHTPKKVKSRFGEIALEVPRDRQSKFEPIVVKKASK